MSRCQTLPPRAARAGSTRHKLTISSGGKLLTLKTRCSKRIERSASAAEERESLVATRDDDASVAVWPKRPNSPDAPTHRKLGALGRRWSICSRPLAGVGTPATEEKRKWITSFTIFALGHQSRVEDVRCCCNSKNSSRYMAVREKTAGGGEGGGEDEHTQGGPSVRRQADSQDLPRTPAAATAAPRLETRHLGTSTPRPGQPASPRPSRFGSGRARVSQPSVAAPSDSGVGPEVLKRSSSSMSWPLY